MIETIRSVVPKLILLDPVAGGKALALLTAFEVKASVSIVLIL
jgi:hypothetical protein